MRFVIAFFLTVAAIWVFGAASLAGWKLKEASMQTEAIERGCAAYDSKTGAWGWK